MRVEQRKTHSPPSSIEHLSTTSSLVQVGDEVESLNKKQRTQEINKQEDDSAAEESEAEEEFKAATSRRMRRESKALAVDVDYHALQRRVEERREEDEMEWRDRALALQVQHEKEVIRIHAQACQSQMQVLASIARLVYQFFGGGGNDGLGGVMALQVMQNLEHYGGAPELGESGKPDSNLPSEFM